MRKIALLLCLSLIMGMAAGCASEQAYVPTGHGLADQQPLETTADMPVNSTAASSEEEPKEFTLAYYENEGFNPYTCANINNRMLFSLMYQGLFFVDREYHPVPILCKSYMVSADLCHHTFELEDATFSDGTPMTADDVVASLKAAENNDYYRGRFDNIGDIYALEGNRVRIDTYIAYENLPMLLDIPIVKVSQTGDSMPMGTGPYALAETAAGWSLMLRGDWWCSAQLPVSAASIPLMKASGSAQIRDSFEFDNLGISISDPGSANYAEYRCDYELWEAETGLFLYLVSNAESPVFSNNKIRTALTYAIDRYVILEKAYHGFGSIATLPASPSSPFYDRGLADKISYDPQQLRQAVQEEGMEGHSVVLMVNKSDPVRVEAAQMVADMLIDCGLDVKLLESSTEYYKQKLNSDEWDIYLGQTRLSANMDLSGFFAPYGKLSSGGLDDPAAYSMTQEALENSGNFFNLHQLILRNGQMVPVLFRTYAVYARRGLAESLQPSRDNVFFYSLGKTMDQIMTVETPEE